MSLSVLTLATEEHSELPIHPYAVGGVSLGILLLLIVVLLAFGNGREHS